MKIILPGKENIFRKVTPNKEPVRIGLEEDETQSIADISQLQLSELARRDIAIEVYSEILECTIWLCSNQGMATQVKKDDPETVTYTVDEIMNLIKLNPDPEELKRIHNAKEVFVDSRIVDSKLRNKS